MESDTGKGIGLEKKMNLKKNDMGELAVCFCFLLLFVIDSPIVFSVFQYVLCCRKQ